MEIEIPGSSKIIKTKYKPTDEVYIIFDGTIRKSMIRRVIVEIDYFNKATTFYQIDSNDIDFDSVKKEEEDVFESIEELGAEWNKRLINLATK